MSEAPTFRTFLRRTTADGILADDLTTQGDDVDEEDVVDDNPQLRLSGATEEEVHDPDRGASDRRSGRSAFFSSNSSSSSSSPGSSSSPTDSLSKAESQEGSERLHPRSGDDGDEPIRSSPSGWG